MKIIVVGAGVFGLTAAIELRHRGHDVTLVDRAPLTEPHALGSSVDSSRAIRMDYGDDSLYVELARSALESWRGEWRTANDRTLYREAGFLFASAAPFERVRGFEAASFETLQAHKATPRRLERDELVDLFEIWEHAPWVDGYFNEAAGYADAAAVVAMLLERARMAGVHVLGSRRIVGCGPKTLHDSEGGTYTGDRIVIAGGAWTSEILPELAPALRSTAQTVLYFEPVHAERFAWRRYPTWAWDIANQGWYGFPATEDGLVKVAHHGAGRSQPADDRSIDEDMLSRARGFLAQVLPQLADAPLAEATACFYCDSIDGDFWITPVPNREGIFVATGGSGHGFKFAPITGDLIANCVLGCDDERLGRFAWRKPERVAREHARAPSDAYGEAD